MVTQTITINLMQSRLAPIIMRSEEKGREIQFDVIDEAGEPEDLTGYDLKFMMIKPDGNVVYKAISSLGILTQTEQMTTSRGKGYYCIRILDDDTVIYSGQGPVVIDDHVIDDETLDSISEVDGLVFPDDFYTKDDNVAIIDDNVISTEKTWSSSKIASEIASPDYTETATGNPIELTDAADAPVVSLKTEIQGSQDLHGYDKPWVGGAGKNKLNPSAPVETFDLTGEGTYRYGISFEGDKTYTIVNNTSSSTGFYYRTPKSDLSDRGTSVQIYANSYVTVVVPSDCILWFFTSSISGWENYVADFAVNIGNDTDFTPYSNICPITAVSTGDIEVSDGDTITTHTTAFSPAIYKGSEDVTNSTISIEWDMIASYSGETLPGEWISDRDEYVPGTTPTTGAQVAYELAAPISASVLPTNLPIRTHSGYTRIDSSTGEMEVEYIKSSAQSLVDLIEAVTR